MAGLCIPALDVVQVLFSPAHSGHKCLMRVGRVESRVVEVRGLGYQDGLFDQVFCVTVCWMSGWVVASVAISRDCWGSQ